MPEQGKSANQIFISYRRDDSAAVTGRIYDRLVLHFGHEAVFKDVDSIPLGVNFRTYIDSIIAQCAVVLVVIGDRWAGPTNEPGKTRLHDQRDFVRIELESALQRDIPIIPLLVQDALMPSDEELPQSLVEFAYRNGTSVGHDPHFHTDVERLVRNLENYFASRAPATPVAPPTEPRPTQRQTPAPVDEPRQESQPDARPGAQLPASSLRAGVGRTASSTFRRARRIPPGLFWFLMLLAGVGISVGVYFLIQEAFYDAFAPSRPDLPIGWGKDPTLSAIYDRYEYEAREARAKLQTISLISACVSALAFFGLIVRLRYRKRAGGE